MYRVRDHSLGDHDHDGRDRVHERGHGDVNGLVRNWNGGREDVRGRGRGHGRVRVGRVRVRAGRGRGRVHERVHDYWKELSGECELAFLNSS